MNYLQKACALSALAVACFPFLAFAATSASLTAPLRLEDAIRATVQYNPQLIGYDFKVKALAGEQQTAALRPELRAAADVENIAGTGEFKGTDGSELTLSVSSVIELGDQRDARMGLVTARQQQLASAQRVLMLNVLTEVTHQFIQVVAAQEQHNLVKEARQLAQQTLDSLSQQVRAGKTPEADLWRAQAALARAEIAVQRAAQGVRTARITLSTYWADPAPSFSVVADLYATPPALALPDVQAQLATNPDILLLAEDLQVRTAALRQARSEGRSKLEWNLGVRHMQATDDTAMVAGISMPLGSTKRASGAIATARAEQQGIQLALDSTHIQLQAELRRLFEEHQQAVSELTALRTQVLPALKRAERETAAGFERGRYSYLEFNLAQHELLDAQQAYIETAVRVQGTRIDLERITGAALNKKISEVNP